jgi:heat shock protein HspQ
MEEEEQKSSKIQEETNPKKRKIESIGPDIITNNNLKKMDKYNDESSLEDIVKDTYTGKKQKYIEEHLKILDNQGIDTAQEWKSLKPDEKSKFPLFLKLKLDEILCKIFKFYSISSGPYLTWNNIIDENNWKENLGATVYANELLNQKEIDLGDQVKKIEMKSWLQNNEKRSPNIFCRNSQKQLWNEVLDYLESYEDTHAIVTGNPGIGKSRSMSYLLRLLLQKKKIFVYESKKDKVAHIFMPQEDNSYKVWSCEGFRPESCAHLKNPDNYYLIDPCTPSNPVSVLSHTVLCASPNISHYMDFQKTLGVHVWLMPTWKKEELKCLQNEIEVEPGIFLSNDEFEKRYQLFGGKIRYIYCDSDDYQKFSMYLHDSVEELDLDQLSMGLSNRVVYVNQSKEKGPSMLFSYDLSETCENYKMNRENLSVSVSSQGVHQLLAVKYWGKIMETLNPKNPKYSGNSIQNGRFFEWISSVFLEFPVTLKAFDKKHHYDHDLNLIQGKKKEFSGEWDQYLDYCSKLKENNSIREIVTPKVKNQPVIDFMDQRNRGYQITVGKEHAINRKNIQNIFENLKISTDNPFYLYFVVLECNAQEFKWYYEGEFNIDTKVQSIENMNVKMLKDQLKDKYVGVNSKNKEELVKLMLAEQNISSETSNDILKKIEACLRIYYIAIPEEPDKKT